MAEKVPALFTGSNTFLNQIESQIFYRMLTHLPKRTKNLKTFYSEAVPRGDLIDLAQMVRQGKGSFPGELKICE